MNLEASSLSGVWVIRTSAFQDNRGAFSRLFCLRELGEIFDQKQIVQINYSKTSHVGAIRGLHYQNAPNTEMKIVRCIKGSVFDVAVDLRPDSQTFLKWTAIKLTSENNTAFVIPEGCGHGFQVLEQDSELLYLHTAFYSPNDEGGIRFDDPMIGIDWPLTPVDISKRDQSHQYLTESFKGIVL